MRQLIEQRERKKNIPKVLIELRMAHYEQKRKDKIKLLREVRTKISKIYSHNIGKTNNYRGG